MKIKQLLGMMALDANANEVGKIDDAEFDPEEGKINAITIVLKKNIISIDYSTQIEPSELASMLVDAGYARVDMVEGAGQFAMRGGIIDVYPNKKEQVKIPFQPKRINEFLGTDIAEEAMIDIFKRLWIELKDGELLIPSWRTDLLCFADVAEEIARIYGYNKIESTSFCVSARSAGFESSFANLSL